MLAVASLFLLFVGSDAVKCGFNVNKCTSGTAEVGKKYKSGKILCSGKEAYQFGINDDGDLVLCEENVQIWSAGIDSASYFVHHKKGNLLAIGEDDEVLWSSKTKGETDAEFQITNKGKAQLTDKDSGDVLWQNKNKDKEDSNSDESEEDEDGDVEVPECFFRASKCVGDSIDVSSQLSSGEHLCNGRYNFGTNMVGQIALCKKSKLVWSKNAKQPQLKIQADGNLILKSQKSGNNVWSSYSKDMGADALVLTDDGDVQLVKTKSNGKQTTLWSLQEAGVDTDGGVDNVVTQPIDIDEANRVGGMFNIKTDICKTKNDGKCPCYPDDDDYYCPDEWHPWVMLEENYDNDKLYDRCDMSRIPKCASDEMLCPMRKPRIDRFYDEKKRDPYYFVDYDCIQCVPKSENCSKCSPGLYCPPLGRCVGPNLVQWCKKNFPDLAE